MGVRVVVVLGGNMRDLQFDFYDAREAKKDWKRRGREGFPRVFFEVKRTFSIRFNRAVMETVLKNRPVGVILGWDRRNAMVGFYFVKTLEPGAAKIYYHDSKTPYAGIPSAGFLRAHSEILEKIRILDKRSFPLLDGLDSEGKQFFYVEIK